jgi:hypothetical protein
MTEDEDDYHPPYSGVATWNNEEWLIFSEAVGEIVANLGHSQGVAERTLRTLCGCGDVRSICCDEDFDEEPTIIKPEEWRDIGELDLHGKVVTKYKLIKGQGFVGEEKLKDVILVSEALAQEAAIGQASDDRAEEAGPWQATKDQGPSSQAVPRRGP